LFRADVENKTCHVCTPFVSDSVNFGQRFYAG
jgi:hypothetical protein